jgi:hypothetical protein
MLVAKPYTTNVCNNLSFQNRAFFRANPNGSVSSAPFRLATGQYLVVTDVEWSAYGGPLGTVNLLQGKSLRLAIALTQGQTSTNVFFSRSITLDADTATGRPGSSEQLTAGFVVGSGATICPSVVQTTPSYGATSYIDEIVLRGYTTTTPVTTAP